MLSVAAATSQDYSLSPLVPKEMQQRGTLLDATASREVLERQIDLETGDAELPTALLSKIMRKQVTEVASTRSARDAEIYRAVSPSVVEILTRDGLGSGSMISKFGEIITSYHVVKGYAEIAAVFKPAIEGKKPTRDDVKLGRVVRFDEATDLALVKIFDIPLGRDPIRLGDSSDIAVGADVHAIGHPTGEAWTYTKGIISQYRTGYEWISGGVRHKADVIQTQTPINPGNSGGPLIGDSATLLGVNAFKSEGSEGLNFAISVDDVKRFLSRPGDRLAEAKAPKTRNSCKPSEISRSRNQQNNAVVIEYDFFCTGRVSADYVIPDKKTDPIMLMVDRNGDGKPDVVYFDFKRQQKWDLSLWDESFGGTWTLVGHHLVGNLTPTSFESYEAFQRRTANR